MDRTRRIARLARRRMLAADLVARCGRWLSVGAVCGLGAALAAKVLHIPLAWPWLIGTPLLIAATGAVVASVSRSRSLLSAASVVEERLGLKSRLSTGLALGSVAPNGDPFQALAAEEAEVASMQAGVSSAVPIRFGRAWMIWPALAALAVGTALWVPHVDLFGARSRAMENARKAEQRTLLAQEIADAVNTTQSRDPHEAAAARPEQVKALEEIEKELATGTIDPRTAAQRASEAMTSLADAKDSAAEQASREQQAMRQAMGALPEQQPGATLSRAMRDGDLAGAAQAAESLAENAMKDAEQRAAAATELEQLANDLRTLSEREDRAASPSETRDSAQPPIDQPQNNAQRDRSDRRPETIQEQLRQQGVDDKTQGALAQSQDSSEIDKRLKEAGVQPEAAERLAREIARENQDRRTDQRVREQARELADAAQDAARELRDPPKPADTRASQESAAENAQKDAREQPDRAKPDSSRREQSSSSEESAANAANQKKSGAEKQQARESASSGERQKDSQKAASEGQRSEQSSKTANEQRSSQKGSEQSADKGSREQAEKGSPERSESGTQTEGQKPKAESGTKSDSSQSQPSEHQGTDSDAKSSGQKAEGKTQKDPDAAPRQSGDPSSTDTSPRGNAPSDQTQDSAPRGIPRPSSEKDAQPNADRQEGTKQQAAGGEGESQRSSERDPKSPAPTREQGPSKQDGRQPHASPTEPADPGQQRNSKQGQEPTADPSTSPNKDAMKRFADRLREQAEKGQNAQRDQQQARDLRKRAEEMLERMSPEQREQMQQWARDMQRDTPDRPQDAHGSGQSSSPIGGGPGDQPSSRPTAAKPTAATPRTELIDGRTRTPSDRTNSAQDQTIAEWLGSGDGRGESGGTDAPGENDGTVREAMRSAERAIDDRAVPQRFDNLLQRYFRRLPQNLEGKGNSPSAQPASQPAKDAP